METIERSAAIFDSEEYVAAFVASRALALAQTARYLACLEALVADQSLQGRRIADLGAGPGRFSVPFAQAVGQSGEVLAIDFSSKMIEHLKSLASIGNSITPVESEFSAISSFRGLDVVWSSETIHLVRDLKKLLREVHVSLRPGGAFVVRTSTHRQLLERDWYKFFPSARTVDLERHPSNAILIDGLQAAGFTKIQNIPVDDSTVVDCDDYVKIHRDRCYSTLSMIDSSEFDAGMARMTADLRGRRWVERDMRMTLTTAIKAN